MSEAILTILANAIKSLRQYKKYLTAADKEALALICSGEGINAENKEEVLVGQRITARKMELAKLETRVSDAQAEVDRLKEEARKLEEELAALPVRIKRASKVSAVDGTGEVDDTADIISSITNVSIDEISKQYQLVIYLREQLLDPDNLILESTSVKELSALIGAMNSVISLFIRQQEKLDKYREVANILKAVQAALATVPKEAQQVFMNTLKNFT